MDFPLPTVNSRNNGSYNGSSLGCSRPYVDHVCLRSQSAFRHLGLHALISSDDASSGLQGPFKDRSKRTSLKHFSVDSRKLGSYSTSYSLILETHLISEHYLNPLHWSIGTGRFAVGRFRRPAFRRALTQNGFVIQTMVQAVSTRKITSLLPNPFLLRASSDVAHILGQVYPRDHDRDNPRGVDVSLSSYKAIPTSLPAAGILRTITRSHQPVCEYLCIRDSRRLHGPTIYAAARTLI